MGCCGDDSVPSVLFRDLPQDVLAIRRVAFAALRHQERLDSGDLRRRAGLDEQAVRGALEWLDQAGLVELDTDGRIIGIAGLTLESTGHELVLEGKLLHTWCAIDAVGIPAALSLNARVTTMCAHCGTAITLNIDNGEPPSASPLRGWIPPTDCTNVRADLCPFANLFCSLDHLERWRAAAGQPPGEVGDLPGFAEIGRLAWGDLAAKETGNV